LPFTVGLPLKIVIFQFAMLVYQRVWFVTCCEPSKCCGVVRSPVLVFSKNTQQPP
jgi:hypothetical protein